MRRPLPKVSRDAGLRRLLVGEVNEKSFYMPVLQTLGKNASIDYTAGGTAA